MSASSSPRRVLAGLAHRRAFLDSYAHTVRVLDQLTARIDAAWPHPRAEDLREWNETRQEWRLLHETVELLCQDYTDHPDYQPDWTPNEQPTTATAGHADCAAGKGSALDDR